MILIQLKILWLFFLQLLIKILWLIYLDNDLFLLILMPKYHIIHNLYHFHHFYLICFHCYLYYMFLFLWNILFLTKLLSNYHLNLNGPYVETSLPFFNEAINNLIVDLEYFLLLFSVSIINILTGKSTRTGIFSSQSNIYYFKKFFDFVFCFCISLV